MLLPLWSRVHAISRGKLEPLYLHYHNIYGHKTWQGGDFVRLRDKLKVLYPHYNNVYGHKTLQDDDLT